MIFEASLRPTSQNGFRLFIPALALLLFATHAPFLRLPYFWDEAGYFVLAARDILDRGEWIPTSTVPNIHPPGLMAYLALLWRVAGYSPLTTRVAMLLLAACGLAAVALLARELCPDYKSARLAVLCLFVSPLFYVQSMLAQLDAAAMLFTALALLFFLRGRLALSIGSCILLVMVKETGLAMPLVLAAWLGRERRWRAAACFLLPGLCLAAWVAFLAKQTGHWAGSLEFASYNLRYPLDPFRLAVSLGRRLYYLFAADSRWIGTVAIALSWKTAGSLFRSRPWRIAFLFTAAHVALVVVLGGASLERYLLPVMPVIFALMVTCLFLQPHLPRILAAGAFVAAVAAGNWINPPYPFPYENNLAMIDFLDLQQAAARYLTELYPHARVETIWPLTLELSRPELGFVSHQVAVAPVPDLTADSLRKIRWRGVEVFVAFSRSWDGAPNLMQFSAIHSFWQRHYGREPATRRQMPALISLPLSARFERRGQWVDIYSSLDIAAPELQRRSASTGTKEPMGSFAHHPSGRGGPVLGFYQLVHILLGS